MTPYLGTWIIVIVVFLITCLIARYIIKKASQGEPLVGLSLMFNPLVNRARPGLAAPLPDEKPINRARPGLAAPLPDEKPINIPIKVIISFDRKGEKFLNVDIILIRKSLESIAKSLKEISKRK